MSNNTQGGNQNKNQGNNPNNTQQNQSQNQEAQKQDTTLFDGKGNNQNKQQDQSATKAEITNASQAYDEYAKEMTQKNNTTSENTGGDTGDNDPSEQKNMTWQIIISVIIIIILVLIFALPGGNKSPNSEDSDRSEGVVEDIDNDQDILATEFSSPRPMQPVIDGDFEYKFEGIIWEMTEIETGTAVAFRFDNFSRRNDNPVIFNRPFRIGSYEGTCVPVSQLNLDATETGVPLAFAQCVRDSGTLDIIIMQEGEDIVVKRRTVDSGSLPGSFETFFTRTITELVR